MYHSSWEYLGVGGGLVGGELDCEKDANQPLNLFFLVCVLPLGQLVANASFSCCPCLNHPYLNGFRQGRLSPVWKAAYLLDLIVVKPEFPPAVKGKRSVMYWREQE